MLGRAGLNVTTNRILLFSCFVDVSRALLRGRRRICSTDEFFNTRSNALTTHLIKKGNQHRFVKEDIEKVRQIPNF